MAATQPPDDDSPRTVGCNREGRGFAAARAGGEARQLARPTFSAAGRIRVAVIGNWNICDPQRAACAPYGRNRGNSARDAMDRSGAILHRLVSPDRVPGREKQ